jgi:multiple sugar transport system ATP-binding protein
MTMGDRIVVLKDGIINQIGNPLGLYNTPVNRFVAGFIGSPPMNFIKVSLKAEGGKVFADEGNFRIELNPQQGELLRNYVGKDAIFGVRPEDLLYSEAPMATNNITTKVEVIEPLGAEIHLWVSTKHNQLVARVAPRFVFHVDDTANLHPDLNKIHFFDIETEKAIF